MNATRIRGLSVRDVRFPKSKHSNKREENDVIPEHCCAYVILYTDSDLRGHGLTYTNGGGNELVVSTIKDLSRLVVGKTLNNIFNDFGHTLRFLKHESMLRSMGPEKGIIHLAMAALTNALFDLWSRLNHKPLWKFLVDMEPEQLASIVDFGYIKDVLTHQEVVEILHKMKIGKDKRERELLVEGYPSYFATSDLMEETEAIAIDKCRELLIAGWTHFKVDFNDTDKNSLALVRSVIGKRNALMIDAKQLWTVDEAVRMSKMIQEIGPTWIEEPTSAEDILGHLTIKKVYNSLGIKIGSGKSCQSKIVLKQFFQAEAIDICQLDFCKVGGISDALAVYLMAKKFDVPVSSTAGGLGQGEMAQHIQFWDFICVSGQKEQRFIECHNLLTNHLKFPKKLKNNFFLAPRGPGNGSELLNGSVADFEYPIGPEWKKLFFEGLYTNPVTRKPPYVESLSIEEDLIRNR